MKDQEDDLIKRTIALWQPYYSYQLTQEDAREIIENIKAYCTLLMEWQEREDLAASGKDDKIPDRVVQHNVTLGIKEDEKN